MATYSFFFHAIVAITSAWDFREKISAVVTWQAAKNGSFQVFTTNEEAATFASGIIINIFMHDQGYTWIQFTMPCCTEPAQLDSQD